MYNPSMWQINQKGIDYLGSLGIRTGNKFNKFQELLGTGKYSLAEANRIAGTNFSTDTLAKLEGFQGNLTDMEKYLNTQNNLGLAGTVINGIGTAANVGLGIYGAIQQDKLYKQQLEHAENVFNLEKGLANRNLANQSKLVNEQAAARANLAAQFTNNGAKNYSDVKNEYYNKNKVDGSAIV